MAPREDLVSSAVTFLQDPSVSSAPVEKRIEFLKSKNLTQEEIDISLARAGPGPSQPPALPPNASYYPPDVRGAPSQRYPYPYNPYGEWHPPPPPPEPPRRDWRDYFIMATVIGGASYGLYVLAQRYVKPLIAPPTPPQLEQDKAAIDEQFNKAFALLDTLSSDTAALKEAEEARTQRLDAAITDIETIVADLKSANMKREDDARRMESDIKTMKDSLPRSIDSVRDASERQLKELSSELASLKLLMGNRMGGSGIGPAGVSIPRTQPATLPSSSSTVPAAASASADAANGTIPTPASAPAPARQTPAFTTTAPQYPPATTTTTTPAGAPRPASVAPLSGSANKSAIPAWQLAAAGKSKSDFTIAPATGSAPTTNGSGSVQPDGADAVAALNAS